MLKKVILTLLLISMLTLPIFAAGGYTYESISSAEKAARPYHIVCPTDSAIWFSDKPFIVSGNYIQCDGSVRKFSTTQDFVDTTPRYGYTILTYKDRLTITSHDIKDTAGNVVFQPPHWARALPMGEALRQTLTLVPLIIGGLVLFLGFRKALAMLLRVVSAA